MFCWIFSPSITMLGKPHDYPHTIQEFFGESSVLVHSSITIINTKNDISTSSEFFCWVRTEMQNYFDEYALYPTALLPLA